MSDLLPLIDMDKLRELCTKRNIQMPTTAEQEIDMHLRILLARWAERFYKRDLSKFSSTAKMSPNIKTFFNGGIFKHGEFYMIESPEILRGWRPEIFTPKWTKNIVEEPETVKKEVKIIDESLAIQSAEIAGRVGEPLSKDPQTTTINPKWLFEAVPKTIARRQGAYSYIILTVDPSDLSVGISTGNAPVHGRTVGSFHTMSALSYFRVFDRIAGVSVVRGHPIVFDEYFFVMGRKPR